MSPAGRYDDDGRLDLFIANGAVTLREEQRGSLAPFKERNLLLHNEAGKVADVTNAASAFRLLEVTRGAAFGDIDNDGRVDILITINNGPARLLFNRSRPAGWVAIQADGGGTVNRDALGARYSAPERYAGSGRTCAHGFELLFGERVHFGLGDRVAVDWIQIAWPEGRVDRWNTPTVNRTVKLIRGTGYSH